jgi:hypothetical protein
VVPEREKGLWLCRDELFVRLDTYITRMVSSQCLPGYGFSHRGDVECLISPALR